MSNENTLLTKLKHLPPEYHRLPSGGLLYKNNELNDNVKNGEIEFYPYTAIDELDMKSPDLMLDGRAITRVLNRCVPGIRKPLDLYVRDLDFIMMALRKASYGDTYEISYVHDCEHAKRHDYKISLTKLMNKAKFIDPSTLSNMYTVTVGTDDISYTVNLRPLRAKHAIDILQHFDKELTDEERKMNLFSIFMFSINDVDGITDTKSILEWLGQIPIMWLDPINTRIEEISNWGVSPEVDEVCQDCGAPIKLIVQVNPLTFFI